MNIISQLANPSTMTGQRSVEYYTNLWIDSFPQGANRGKSYYKKRLAELESWDTSNSKPNERAGKIAALKALLNNRNCN